MNIIQDSQGHAVQGALPFRRGAAQKLTLVAGAVLSAPFTTTAPTKVISVFPKVEVAIALGDASVVATAADDYLPANQVSYIGLALSNGAVATHISILQLSGGGDVYISERL